MPRVMLNDGGLARAGRAGDGFLQHSAVIIISADAADTLTATKISAGTVSYSGLTAGRNLTVDTAANILAVFPYLDVGDAVAVHVGISTAFALTLVTAAGITLKGKATVPASSSAIIYFVKTAATTMDCVVV